MVSLVSCGAVELLEGLLEVTSGIRGQGRVTGAQGHPIPHTYTNQDSASPAPAVHLLEDFPGEQWHAGGRFASGPARM